MKYVAILRGINVGGRKKILMKDLITVLSSLSLTNIETYIQSGNVSFYYSGKLNVSELEPLIEQKIEDQYEFKVPVIIRSSEQLQNIVNSNPYSNKDNSQLYVTFNKTEPSVDIANLLDKSSYLPDLFESTPNHIYILCNTKYSDTKLNNNFFEKKLKVTTTTRNWKTVNKLFEMSL